MQKITLLNLLLILCFSAHAQAPPIQWQRCLGGTGADGFNSIEPTPDGGYIATGLETSVDGDVSGGDGTQNVWVVKMDDNGNILWEKSLGGSGTDYAFSAQFTPDGGYIVAGYTTSTDGDVSGNDGGMDWWVVKLDSTGTIQWQKTYGGTGIDYARSIQPTPDGGYVAGGVAESADGDITLNHGIGDFWVLKLDASGTIQWQQCYGGSGYESLTSLDAATDGGYILSGVTAGPNSGSVSGFHGVNDGWIVKIDSTGAEQWTRSLGGSLNDIAHSVQQLSDGNFIVAAWTDSNNGDLAGNNNPGSPDFWVIKLDTAGTILWQTSFGAINSAQMAYSIRETAEGGFIVAGNSYLSSAAFPGSHGQYDFWLVKLDAAGAIEWHKYLGSPGSEEAFSVSPTPDGGFITTGSTDSNGGQVSGHHGGIDAWVVKLSPVPTGTSDLPLTERLVLRPNPATTRFTVQSSGSSAGDDYIIVDSWGRKVSGGSLAGETTAVDISSLAPGIYYLRLATGPVGRLVKVGAE
jgi:hypothetical protein